MRESEHLQKLFRESFEKDIFFFLKQGDANDGDGVLCKLDDDETKDKKNLRKAILKNGKVAARRSEEEEDGANGRIQFLMSLIFLATQKQNGKIL